MDVEFWKAVAMVLIGSMMTMLPALWAVTRRPTFTQMDAAILKHESGSCYAKDRKVIEEKLFSMAADISKLDRHVEGIRRKVEEIHLDVEARRRLRSKAPDTST